MNRPPILTTLLVLLTTLALVSTVVDSRPFGHNPQISDGLDYYSTDIDNSLLLMGGDGEKNKLDGEAECLQLYGFLPCSNSLFGHFFLIVVYEFLLFHGESYIAAGSEQIFKILGPGLFGATAFHILGALPESLILLASGLVNTKENAQEYVYTGVGLLAGSSILMLTLLWGTCTILGSTEFSSLPVEPESSTTSTASTSTHLQFKKLVTSPTNCGIVTDTETSYTARIMVISVIPLVVIQFANFFPSQSFELHVLIFFTLAIAVLLLLFYFGYQLFEPWIQTRRLEFVKHEDLVLRIVQHVQKRALERLLTKNGAPNLQAIKRSFEEIDQDNDDRISPAELKDLLLEIKFKHMHLSKDKAVEEVLKDFDLDRDQTISKDEFVNGFIKWLEEAKIVLGKQSRSKKSFKDLYQAFQPFIQKKKEERELKNNLIAEILRHIQNRSVEGLLSENGAPDLPTIRRLFENIDRDGNNFITQSELRELIGDIKFGTGPSDVDEAVACIIEFFDSSGDQMIDESEFVSGLTKWLDTTNHGDSEPPQTKDSFFQKSWEETDKLVDAEKEDGKLWWIWSKAVGLVLLGIIILSVLAEPLIYSVRNFSESASIPSFFIAFVLVPWATNARGANSAIEAARRKKPRTTSLTFSEIYSGVFVSNVLGLCVLLSLIYGRDMTWEFSAEVGVVAIVCLVIGLVAGFRSKFPVWTSILAYLLYPLSLLTFYILLRFTGIKSIVYFSNLTGTKYVLVT